MDRKVPGDYEPMDGDTELVANEILNENEERQSISIISASEEPQPVAL